MSCQRWHKYQIRLSRWVFDAGESAILSPVNVVAAEEETRSNCHPKSEFMPLRSFSWKIYVLPAALMLCWCCSQKVIKMSEMLQTHKTTFLLSWFLHLGRKQVLVSWWDKKVKNAEASSWQYFYTNPPWCAFQEDTGRVNIRYHFGQVEVPPPFF